MQFPAKLEGGVFEDERGKLVYNNLFDMTHVKRFYSISHPDTLTIRAWQGHKAESKWFHCIRGSFRIKLVKIDNWETPSKTLPIQTLTLSEGTGQVLHVPSGYANGFQAGAADSMLLVFSDQPLSSSQNDDFRYSPDYWGQWNEI